MKNLENYGVQTLNAKEIRETDGGDLGIGELIAIAGAIIYVYDNWDEGVQSFWDGYYTSIANNYGMGAGAGGSW